MKVKKRRPYLSEYPNGYLESDRDFMEANHDLILTVLEPNAYNKTQTLKVIDFHWKQINELSSKLVEAEARKILADHPNLDEFIMAMGSAFFTDKNSKHIGLGDYKYLKSFERLIDDLDNLCRIKGEPMRFTVTGKKITDW